ncbi:MAG TPA: hypothetical protein VFQ53_33755 [Kofleriaceae bacterium]|nr:hypothetical protein [Kofleriaceae bacterium]
MRSLATAGLAVLAWFACTACNASIGVGGGADAPIGDDDDGGPPPPDTTPPLGPWGTPTKIASASDPARAEDDGTLSYSGLELVFAVVDPNDANRKDLFYASRPDLQSDFGAATKLPFSALGTSEETPRFSPDDLSLFFAKTNGTNGLDVFQVTRPTALSQMWGTPTAVAGVNSTQTDKWFMPCGASYLMIVGADIAEGTMGNPPTIVAELSSASSETGTFLTQDCLTTYFASTRDAGINKIFTASRTSVAAPWTTPTAIVDFNALGGRQQDPFIANDNRTFVFVSDVAGTNDIYISTR